MSATIAEVVAAARKRYALPETPPPCPEHGPLGIQSMSAHKIKWACADGPAPKYGPEWTKHWDATTRYARPGDSDVLALADRLEAAERLLARAEAHPGGDAWTYDERQEWLRDLRAWRGDNGGERGE